MKNVTPTYPLPAQGYDLPIRPEPKRKTQLSRATPTVLEMLVGMTLLLAYAGTLVLAFCFAMIIAASASTSRRNDRFVTGLILGFGLGWLAASSYGYGSENETAGR